MREKKALVEMDNKLANRAVNEGFSGRENVTRFSKWPCVSNHVCQFPRNRFRLILMHYDQANGVNKLKVRRSSIVITYLSTFADYIIPDFVHVLYDGRIVVKIRW